MFINQKHHHAQVQINKMSKVVWESLKHTQIIEDNKEESPREAKRKSEEHDCNKIGNVQHD
jgi:hypothetical protein